MQQKTEMIKLNRNGGKGLENDLKITDFGGFCCEEIFETSKPLPHLWIHLCAIIKNTSFRCKQLWLTQYMADVTFHSPAPTPLPPLSGNTKTQIDYQTRATM